MDKQQIAEKLMNHKDFITTAREWDRYAREYNNQSDRGYTLPLSRTLINKFSSWNELKDSLGIIQKNIVHYDKETLIEIGKKNKNFFISRRIWDEFAKKESLPSSQAYHSAFGRWTEVKRIVGLKTRVKPKSNYTKAEIKTILKEHGENLESRTQWDVYAKENSLPTYLTIRKFFTWEEVLSICKKEKKYAFTKEELITIGLNHYDTFTKSSMSKWDKYARANDLPSSYSFYRMFGTWKKARIAVIDRKNFN